MNRWEWSDEDKQVPEGRSIISAVPSGLRRIDVYNPNDKSLGYFRIVPTERKTFERDLLISA